MASQESTTAAAVESLTLSMKSTTVESEEPAAASEEPTAASEEPVRTASKESVTASTELGKHTADGIDTDRYAHEAFCIPLHDGIEYILDLAGAQYKEHRTIRPYLSYLLRFSNRVPTHQPLGTQARQQEEIIDAIVAGEKHDGLSPGADFRITFTSVHVTKLINLAVSDWETYNTTSLAAALNKKEDAFSADIIDLIGHVHSTVEAWMRMWGSGKACTIETDDEPKEGGGVHTMITVKNPVSAEQFYEVCCAIGRHD